MATVTPLTLLSVFVLVLAVACLSVGAWTWHVIDGLNRVHRAANVAAGRFVATSSDGRSFEVTSLMPATFHAYRTTRSETSDIVPTSGPFENNATVVVLRRGPLRSVQMFNEGAALARTLTGDSIQYDLAGAGALDAADDMPESGADERVVQYYTVHSGGMRGSVGLVNASAGTVGIWMPGPGSGDPPYPSVHAFSAYQNARSFLLVSYMQSWHVRASA